MREMASFRLAGKYGGIRAGWNSIIIADAKCSIVYVIAFPIETTYAYTSIVTCAAKTHLCAT